MESESYPLRPQRLTLQLPELGKSLLWSLSTSSYHRIPEFVSAYSNFITTFSNLKAKIGRHRQTVDVYTALVNLEKQTVLSLKTLVAALPEKDPGRANELL